jgi:hypothetical protein
MTNLAEFVGIMLGDGYLSDNRIKISFNSKESYYIDYVSKIVEDIFDTKPIIKFRKNENTAELFVFKREIIKKIKSIGLINSPKWNNAVIPNKILKYDLDVLRGYFDTDGCVVITNNNGTIYPRIEMKICPSPMQNQFIQILKKYSFRFGVYQIGKGEVRIQLNGKKQLEKWFKLVGSNNQKHINKAKNFIKNR